MRQFYRRICFILGLNSLKIVTFNLWTFYFYIVSPSDNLMQNRLFFLTLLERVVGLMIKWHKKKKGKKKIRSENQKRMVRGTYISQITNKNYYCRS